MTILNGRMTFSLEQELVAEQQETLDDDLVKEAYRQQGLLLLDAETGEGRFRRVIEEYLLTDEAFGEIQGQDTVSFEQLGRLDEEAVAERQVELHVSGGLEIESDLTNSSAALPPPPSVGPYDLPNDPIPIPAFVLYWPTVTPVLSEEEIQPGGQWRGSITVQIGAGQFPLPYSVKLVEYVEDDPVVEVSLGEKEQVAKVGPEEDIALHLSPRGSWTVRISHEDGLWQEGKGEMAFSVRARYKEDEEDEEEIEVEVLKWVNKFAIERIPVTFDDTSIHAGDWKPAAASPASDSAEGSGDEAGKGEEKPDTDADREAPASSPGQSASSEQGPEGDAEEPI
jgi:hypothetical protein